MVPKLRSGKECHSCQHDCIQTGAVEGPGRKDLLNGGFEAQSSSSLVAEEDKTVRMRVQLVEGAAENEVDVGDDEGLAEVRRWTCREPVPAKEDSVYAAEACLVADSVSLASKSSRQGHHLGLEGLRVMTLLSGAAKVVRAMNLR